ncbi:hypothetical protein Taro_000027 [Colocasia esculenta]|uniref:Prolamin-like domain-containing protein n=1 Tax=Colocasia esculenta TaxID=4460 RepID=A0A843TBW0_COLES|nr:hypothetical protein [Colocasia esculenta]
MGFRPAPLWPLHPNRCQHPPQPLNVRSLRSSLHPDAGVLLRELPFRGTDHGLPSCVEGTDSVPHGLLFNVFQASSSLRPEFEGVVAEDIPREDGCPPLCIIAHFPAGDQILRGATCSSSYATATTTEANPDSVNGSKLLVLGFPWWSSIVPTLGDPKTQECWRSLLGTKSCVTSGFQSILAGRFGLSSESCAAIAALGDDCVRKILEEEMGVCVELARGVVQVVEAAEVERVVGMVMGEEKGKEMRRNMIPRLGRIARLLTLEVEDSSIALDALLVAVRKQKNNHTKDKGDLSWFGPSHMEVLRPVPKQPLGISLTKGIVPLKDTTTPSTPAGLLLFLGQEGNPLLF